MDTTLINGAITVAVLIVLDYLTGIIKAIVKKTLDSAIMRVGLWHKFVYVIVALLAWFLQYESAHFDFGFTVPLFIPVVIGISLIEVTSILENCAQINPEFGNSGIMQLFNTDKAPKIAKHIEDSQNADSTTSN